MIVLAYRSADTIAAVLAGLAAQELDESFETIVVASGGDATTDIVRRSFPDVVLFAADGRLTPGAGRNVGIAAARGSVVAFLADDCVPAPDWLARRLEAHRSGHALVGGFIDCAEPSTLAGWAQYFVKFWGMQGLHDRRRVGRGPLMHLSYDAALLGSPFDEQFVAGEDTVFNDVLIKAGHRVWFDGAIRVRHVNDRRWRDVLAGQREQGAATAEACRRHNLQHYAPSARGPAWTPLAQALRAFRVLARRRRRLLGRFVLVVPLFVVAIAIRRRAFRRVYFGRAALPPLEPCGEVHQVSSARFERPKVSAIVAAFDEEAAIADCLDSLLAQTLDELEIVVADDGSTDRTAVIARSRGVRVVSLPHRGAAAAKNAGVAAASGEVVVFVDADLIVEPDCIERLCAPIFTGAAAATFTKDFVVANPGNPWADCWTLNRRAARGEHFPRGMPDRWANLRAVSRDRFLAVGGYDDVGYGEDMTVAPKLGLLADAVPGARMRHRHPDSLREVWQNARWVGRGVVVRRLVSYAPWRSFRRGLRGAFALGRPRYLLFALVYDFGVLSSHLEARLGRTGHAK